MDINTQQQLAVSELAPIVSSASAYESTIAGIEIHDDEQLGIAGDLKKDLNHYRMKIEDKRTSLVKPLNKVVTDINAMFKGPRDKIDVMIGAIGKKMNEYVQRQEAIERQKRLDEEAAERRRADNLRKAAAQAAEVSNEEKPEDDVIVQTIEKQADVVEKAAAAMPARRAAPSRGMRSTVSRVKTWQGSVVDVKVACRAIADGKLPASLVTFSQSDMNDMARSLEQECTRDGIKFEQVVKAGVR